MAKLIDVCSFTSATDGDSDFTDGSAVQGYLNLNAAGASDGSTYSYRAENATRTEWEIGRGVYNAVTGKLSRSPAKSSNGGGLVSFGTNPTVMVTALSDDILTPDSVGVDVQPYDAALSSLIRQNSQSAAYVISANDGGYDIFHPASDNNARTFTIPSNASVPFPVGTVISITNMANTVTIAITSDTLTFLGSGATGSRTLAANGMAVIRKVTATHWVICGVNLS